MFYNDLAEEITVDRNQMAVVGPDGQDYYRAGSRPTYPVKPHDRRSLAWAVTGGKALRKSPGFYLRFDGVWAANGARIDLPPMPIGKPSQSPGVSNSSFTGPSDGTRMAKGRAVDRTIVKATEGAAPPRSTGLQQYTGQRRKLKSVGLKCAAMPMKKTKEMPDDVAFIMDEVLLSELQQTGFEAIGPDDINAMLGFEKVKSAVGCDDASCIAEIGNALGVDYQAAGSDAKLETTMVMTLKLFDVRKTKVLARANRMADGGQAALPRLIGEAVTELVERSGL